MEIRLKLIEAAKSCPESKVSQLVKRSIRRHKSTKKEKSHENYN